MEEGYVRAESAEAIITLSVRTTRERVQRVETVIDTGSNRDLILPSAVIEDLSPPMADSAEVELADGSTVMLAGYRVWVIWHGRLRNVVALEAEIDTALAGMTLLAGSRLSVDVVPGGDVRVEEL